jgi:hypothetical protein
VVGADAEVPAWVAGLGILGLVDIHVHFMPDSVLRKVWGYFDRVREVHGIDWPIRYRLPEPERLATLRSLGVQAFAPLVYPHKPDMAAWLNDWVLEFAREVPEAVPTATFYPEPSVESYLDSALRAGIRCVKVHVQVGGFDPRSDLLDKAWGMLADAEVPAVVHCGHGPWPGAYTGLDVFAEVLERHPRLVAVLAHAGMPDFAGAFELVRRFEGVHLDTTMVGVPFNGADRLLPADWPARLVDLTDRVVLGTDFPNIPHPYAVQLAVIEGWPRRTNASASPSSERSCTTIRRGCSDFVVERELDGHRLGGELALAAETGQLPGAAAGHHGAGDRGGAVLVGAFVAEHEAARAAADAADHPLEAGDDRGAVRAVDHQVGDRGLALDVPGKGLGRDRLGELGLVRALGEGLLVPALDLECAYGVHVDHGRSAWWPSY